jgi:hypothetical protein
MARATKPEGVRVAWSEVQPEEARNHNYYDHDADDVEDIHSLLRLRREFRKGDALTVNVLDRSTFPSSYRRRTRCRLSLRRRIFRKVVSFAQTREPASPQHTASSIGHAATLRAPETDCARTLDQEGQHVCGSAHAVFGTVTRASTLPGLWWQDDIRRDRRRQPALSSMQGVRLPREHPVQFQIDGTVRRRLEEMPPRHFPTHDRCDARLGRGPHLAPRTAIT